MYYVHQPGNTSPARTYGQPEFAIDLSDAFIPLAIGDQMILTDPG